MGFVVLAFVSMAEAAALGCGTEGARRQLIQAMKSGCS